ncbi:hypothetical protein [Chitinimonas sp.]|uniref:hypothetical protein n=1 Tax=Chitinimonas sp. TaxID=1934313 RepID=UPI0035AFB41D
MQLDSGLNARLLALLRRRRMLPLALAALVMLSCWLPRHHASLGMLLLAQYGLLLFWQPLYQTNEPLQRRSMLGHALVAGLLLLGAPVLLPLWIALLAALVASYAVAWRDRWSQRFHLGLLVFYLLLLWLRAMPALAGLPLPYPQLVAACLMGLLLLLACLPSARANVMQRQALDLFYGLLLFLVALLAGVMALVLTTQGRLDYLVALALVMIGAGLMLGMLSWLWNPRGGFAGLGALFSVRMLQLGTPFERWSARLTELSARSASPEAFLASAASALLELPGICGGEWRCAHHHGRFGEVGRYQVVVHANGLRLLLQADAPIAPALRVQFQLLAEMLRQFHAAKEREQRLADYVYVEAVHETGARLTHDIKNLLQALRGLIGAASSGAAPDALLALYQRQLPEVARRLETTLANFASPPGSERLPVADWWTQAQARHASAGIVFETPAELTGEVDAPLFDNVLDNLLRNAEHKRLQEPDVQIRTGLWRVGEQWMLWVEDSGSPIPGARADQLFNRPLDSPAGYGLGLFHAARLATARGYGLQLVSNQVGAVRFHLVVV